MLAVISLKAGFARKCRGLTTHYESFKISMLSLYTNINTANATNILKKIVILHKIMLCTLYIN